MDDGDLDMMNARGHSPIHFQQRCGDVEEGSSEEDDDSMIHRHQRVNSGEGRLRMGRMSPPGRRRGSRGGNRDRGGGGGRRRLDRGDRMDRKERDRRPSKPNLSSSGLPKSSKEESICLFFLEGRPLIKVSCHIWSFSRFLIN